MVVRYVLITSHGAIELEKGSNFLGTNDSLVDSSQKLSRRPV